MTCEADTSEGKGQEGTNATRRRQVLPRAALHHQLGHELHPSDLLGPLSTSSRLVAVVAGEALAAEERLQGKTQSDVVLVTYEPLVRHVRCRQVQLPGKTTERITGTHLRAEFAGLLLATSAAGALGAGGGEALSAGHGRTPLADVHRHAARLGLLQPAAATLSDVKLVAVGP